MVWSLRIIFSGGVAFRRVLLVSLTRVFYNGVRLTVGSEDPTGLADGLLFLTVHQCGRGKGVRCRMTVWEALLHLGSWWRVAGWRFREFCVRAGSGGSERRLEREQSRQWDGCCLWLGSWCPVMIVWLLFQGVIGPSGWDRGGWGVLCTTASPGQRHLDFAHWNLFKILARDGG